MRHYRPALPVSAPRPLPLASNHQSIEPPKQMKTPQRKSKARRQAVTKTVRWDRAINEALDLAGQGHSCSEIAAEVSFTQKVTMTPGMVSLAVLVWIDRLQRIELEAMRAFHRGDHSAIQRLRNITKARVALIP